MLYYYLLYFAVYSLMLHREGIRDFTISVLTSDLCRDMSMAFDAAAQLTDEMLLWSAGPLSVLFKPPLTPWAFRGH